METVLGSVWGVRYYTYEPHANWLRGGYGGRWYSARQRGKCRQRGWGIDSMRRLENNADNPAPHEGHRCGVNMHKIDHFFNTEFRSTYGLSRGAIDLRGCVYPDIICLTEGWGKIIEEETGYRVQDARVVFMFTCFTRSSPLACSGEDWIRRQMEDLLNSGPKAWGSVPFSVYDLTDTFKDYKSILTQEFNFYRTPDPIPIHPKEV